MIQTSVSELIKIVKNPEAHSKELEGLKAKLQATWPPHLADENSQMILILASIIAGKERPGKAVEKPETTG